MRIVITMREDTKKKGQLHVRRNFTVREDQALQMDKWQRVTNWSAVIRNAIDRMLRQLEREQTTHDRQP